MAVIAAAIVSFHALRLPVMADEPARVLAARYGRILPRHYPLLAAMPVPALPRQPCRGQHQYTITLDRPGFTATVNLLHKKFVLKRGTIPHETFTWGSDIGVGGAWVQMLMCAEEMHDRDAARVPPPCTLGRWL